MALIIEERSSLDTEVSPSIEMSPTSPGTTSPGDASVAAVAGAAAGASVRKASASGGNDASLIG